MKLVTPLPEIAPQTTDLAVNSNESTVNSDIFSLIMQLMNAPQSNITMDPSSPIDNKPASNPLNDNNLEAQADSVDLNTLIAQLTLLDSQQDKLKTPTQDNSENKPLVENKLLKPMPTQIKAQIKTETTIDQNRSPEITEAISILDSSKNSNMLDDTIPMTVKKPTIQDKIEQPTKPIEPTNVVMDANVSTPIMTEPKHLQMPEVTNQLQTIQLKSSNNINSMEKMSPVTLTIEMPEKSIMSQSHEMYNVTIKIYPPELGQITAKLKLNKSGSELTMIADNNHIKEIIQTNLPQLREHFLKNDIQINQINVQIADSQTGTQQHHSEKKHPLPTENETDLQGKPGQLIEKKQVISVNSLVDTYA